MTSFEHLKQMESNIIQDTLVEEVGSKIGDQEEVQSQEAVLKNDSKSVGRIPEKIAPSMRKQRDQESDIQEIAPSKKSVGFIDASQILALDQRTQVNDEQEMKERLNRFTKKKVSSRTRTTQKLEMKRNSKPAQKVRNKGHLYQSSSFGSLNQLLQQDGQKSPAPNKQFKKHQLKDLNKKHPQDSSLVTEVTSAETV